MALLCSLSLAAYFLLAAVRSWVYEIWARFSVHCHHMSGQCMAPCTGELLWQQHYVVHVPASLAYAQVCAKSKITADIADSSATNITGLSGSPWLATHTRMNTCLAATQPEHGSHVRLRGAEAPQRPCKYVTYWRMDAVLQNVITTQALRTLDKQNEGQCRACSRQAALLPGSTACRRTSYILYTVSLKTAAANAARPAA